MLTSDRRLLVLAFASIDADHQAQIQTCLDAVRERHGFRPATVFKHSDSSDRVRADFFHEVARSGVEVRVRLIDKAHDWPLEFTRMSSNQRIASTLASTASALPHHLISGGTLLLDLDQKKDGKLCSATAGAINRALRAEGTHSFRKVKCCSDNDRTFGELIQVADMVAGAVRRAGDLQVARYPNWNRIIVPWNEKAPR